MADDQDHLVLDPASFNSAERLECQSRFDASFGDLLRCIYQAVDPRRDRAMSMRIVDRDGVQHFPDQIMQFMVWVQTKRDRPDADLADFDELRYSDLGNAYVKGLLGKGEKTTKPKKSSQGSSSAGSSTE